MNQFTSSSAFKNFISQDLNKVFNEISDCGLLLNKETMKYFESDSALISLFIQKGYKFTMKTEMFIEYLRENSLESVPSMSESIKKNFISFDLLSKINEPINFVKIEKFTGKNITEIVLNSLESLFEPNSPIYYFKIRNALVYWKETYDISLMNKLPKVMKKELVREFPELSSAVSF